MHQQTPIRGLSLATLALRGLCALQQRARPGQVLRLALLSEQQRCQSLLRVPVKVVRQESDGQ